MKRFLFISIFIYTFCHHCTAITKTWTGISGSNWNNSGNWNPAGVPILSDDVIFNTSVNVLIDISPISINSLHFINNSTVLFDCNATRNFRLFSTNTLNPALLVEAGSVFNFDGTNAGTNNSTLDLTVATGSIGNIFGVLNISCTGGATNGPNLDTYASVTNYGIVTVYNGGVIRILPGAGNTGSSSVPVSTILMKDGSLYENLKNGGSFPDGTWESNSLAKTVSPGSNGPTFNGTVYGNLEWNCSSQTTILFLNKNINFNNVDLINTNNFDVNGEFRIKTSNSAGTWTMTINGNLTIGLNSRVVTTAANVTAGNGGRINLKGNLLNNGTLTTNGVAGTINDLEFNGISNQNITNNGTFTGTELDFIMNNAAGITLLTALTLPGNTTNSLQLTSGKITTTAANLLTLIDNAQYTGGSNNSFVWGPMKKIGDDNFIFPVGKGSIYAPIGIVNVSGETATDQFIAEYLRTNPQSVHGILYDAGMDHISFVEYWTLNQNLGSAVKKVSEYVSQYSFCKNLARTYVSRWNGLLWTNEGSTNGGITPFPPLETGTITSVNNLSAFGDFTLITDLLEIQNPLPVFLKDVNAVKYNNDVLVTWELTACCSKDARFEVERSIDKNTFTTFATVNGSETNRFYSVKDYSVNKGTTYYRLKITDYDGKIFFSKIVVILKGIDDLMLITISPSIVQSSAILNIALSKKDMLEFAVTDMNGKAWMKKQIKVESGNNSVEFSFDKLSAGVYHLSVFGKNGFIKTIRFVKQ